MEQTERRQFYRHVLTIAIPIMIQNGITNFVGMLDNIMVGRVGTDPMSGVAICNQLIFVWNLCIFGGLSGIAIFTAQFYGKGDDEGIRYTFRLQMLLGVILTALGLFIFTVFAEPMITLYLHADGGVGSVEATLHAAKGYLAAMCFGFLPFAVTQVYSTTLRSTGETVVPMKGSFLAVTINLIGNYVLIYGKFGAPALGVVGAAFATNISRFVEMFYVCIWTHRHKAAHPFIDGAYRSLRVPGGLVKNCAAKGAPLLINEALWALGQAVLSQNYSLRGLSVIAAFNISSTVSNVFNVAFIAMGSAIGIVIGQELGRGKLDTVKRNANRLCAFSVLLCVASGAALFLVAGVFPKIYNTSDDIRVLAAAFIRISAVCMPIYAYANAAYFVIRSGGRTGITFLFDSCFCWVASIPLAYVLARHTSLPILPLYTCVQLLELVKCAIGFALVQRGVWIRDLTRYA